MASDRFQMINILLCYDRWHNYSIVLIFDELLYEFFVFFYSIGLFIIVRRGQRDIFLASSVHPSVHSVGPHFLYVQNHISVPIGQN